MHCTPDTRQLISCLSGFLRENNLKHNCYQHSCQILLAPPGSSPFPQLKHSMLRASGKGGHRNSRTKESMLDFGVSKAEAPGNLRTGGMTGELPGSVLYPPLPTSSPQKETAQERRPGWKNKGPREAEVMGAAGETPVPIFLLLPWSKPQIRAGRRGRGPRAEGSISQYTALTSRPGKLQGPGAWLLITLPGLGTDSLVEATDRPSEAPCRLVRVRPRGWPRDHGP